MLAAPGAPTGAAWRIDVGRGLSGAAFGAVTVALRVAWVGAETAMGAAVAEPSSGGAAGAIVCGVAGAGTAVGPWIWPSLIWEMALPWARTVAVKASKKNQARAIFVTLVWRARVCEFEA